MSAKTSKESFAKIKYSNEPIEAKVIRKGVTSQYCSVRFFSHIFSLEPLAAVQAIAARRRGTKGSHLSLTHLRWNNQRG